MKLDNLRRAGVVAGHAKEWGVSGDRRLDALEAVRAWIEQGAKDQCFDVEAGSLVERVYLAYRF